MKKVCKNSIIPLLAVIISTHSMGCSKAIPTVASPTDTVINTTPPPPQDTTKVKTYLALGDSYTIGQSVDSSQRYPAQTAFWLLQHGITIAPIKYIATTGWTTANLQAAINAESPLGTYDIVSLLIGVNDQYQGYDTGSYVVRFTQLLQRSIQLASNNFKHVFVLSIPDYSVTPFASGSDTAAISAAINNFNAINRRITAEFNCNYIYITDSTRLAANDASLIAYDGLHPSGKEYKVWSNLLGASIKAAF